MSTYQLNYTGAQIQAALDKTLNAEENTNKVTSISSSSTDTQYPSAKCVYDGLASKSGALYRHFSNVIFSDGTNFWLECYVSASAAFTDLSAYWNRYAGVFLPVIGVYTSAGYPISHINFDGTTLQIYYFSYNTSTQKIQIASTTKTRSSYTTFNDFVSAPI